MESGGCVDLAANIHDPVAIVRCWRVRGDEWSRRVRIAKRIESVIKVDAEEWNR